MGSGPLLIPPPVGRGRTKKGKGALSSRPMECQTHSAEERKGEQKIYDSDVTEVRRPQPRALAHARTYGSVQEREISSLCVSARVRCRWSRVRRRQVINSHARRAAVGEGRGGVERSANGMSEVVERTWGEGIITRSSLQWDHSLVQCNVAHASWEWGRRCI